MKQGIHSMTAEEYHADPAPEPSLSASLAKILCDRTPAHARLNHPRLTSKLPDKPTPAMDLGTAVHALLLQPDLAEQLIVVVEANSWRTNAAKEERDFAWANGLTPLLPPAFETATQMANAARAQITEHTEDLFEKGLCEQVLIWQDDGGVWCRSRLDWLRIDHRSIDDLKTTAAGASPVDLSRRALSDGWDIQAAFYLRGLRAIDPGCGEPDFRFVVLESTPPYGLVVVELDTDVIMLANQKVMHAIRVWGDCLRAGTWNRYSRFPVVVSLPPWEEEQWYRLEESYEAPLPAKKEKA